VYEGDPPVTLLVKLTLRPEMEGDIETANDSWGGLSTYTYKVVVFVTPVAVFAVMVRTCVSYITSAPGQLTFVRCTFIVLLLELVETPLIDALNLVGSSVLSAVIETKLLSLSIASQAGLPL